MMNIELQKKAANRFLFDGRGFSWFLLISVSLVFTFILSPDLGLKRYTYRLGDVAMRDIKAPFDFLIEDMDATDENRKQAIQAVQTVYDHDTTMVVDITNRIHKAFSEVRELINLLKKNSATDAFKMEDKTGIESPDRNISYMNDILKLKKNFEQTL